MTSKTSGKMKRDRKSRSSAPGRRTAPAAATMASKEECPAPSRVRSQHGLGIYTFSLGDCDTTGAGMVVRVVARDEKEALLVAKTVADAHYLGTELETDLYESNNLQIGDASLRVYVAGGPITAADLVDFEELIWSERGTHS
jgi:hypothetical protein